MFDLTSSKLIILGIVALIVVGPKDLPILLRTLGKYIGMVKRQAAEFRHQFDEAMRDAELQQMKKDVEALRQDAENAVREGEQSFSQEMSSAQHDVDQAVGGSIPSPETGTAATPAHEAITHEPAGNDGNGLVPPAQLTPAEVAAEAAAPKSGA